jgi:hypothetical protein
VLDYVAKFLKATFSAMALLKRGRATHRFGVGAQGQLRIVDRPAFPEHGFFRPGAVFPVRLRHATLEFEDDAALDIRGAALKLADTEEESPLDLIMNTGEASLFRDAVVFLDFLRAKGRGPAGLSDLAKKYPREMAVGVSGFRRAPASFSQLYYHSQIIFHFRAHDGVPRFVRYRLIPEDLGAEQGLPTPEDARHPLRQERRSEETRPLDYLRQEFKARLARGNVVYHLQLQIHVRSPGDAPEVLDTSRTWDEATHPWLDLATVVLDRALPDEVTERLRFNIGHQPDTLGILRATGIRDYSSIGYLRTRVYPSAQSARLLGRAKRSSAKTPVSDVLSRPPLTAEALVLAYQALPDPEQRQVSAFLASRTALVTAGRSPSGNKTHRAIGRLVFEDRTRDGSDKPLHHLSVELWDRDIGKPDDFLGRGTTDAEGRFDIAYDPADAGPGDLPDLDLRIFEVSPAFDVGNGKGTRRRLIFSVRGPDDVTAKLYDFGTIRMPYWEYDPGPLPRVYVPPGADLPQAFAPGRGAVLRKSLTQHINIRSRHQLLASRDPKSLNLTRIHADYPENLTRTLERTRPGYSRSDEYFGERILNGFYPAPLAPDGPLRYRLSYNWDAYEHGGIYEVANVDARFSVEGSRFMPRQITVQLREPSGHAPFSPLRDPEVLTPKDGDRWQQAKRIFRVAHFLAGEIDGHLARGHLDVEQYAVAAFRNLRKSPLTRLLFPHLKEVASINAQGAWLVFGDTGYVPRASALTPRSVDRRFFDQMSEIDWYGFRPLPPVTEGHVYAKVENLYWEVLTEHIDGFFDQQKAAITQHWSEILAFSWDLVEHSVPCAAPLATELSKALGSAPRLPRREVHGVVRALHPVTESREPEARDLENLKQLCRYVIFRATLWHTWLNDLQYEDGGDVAYGSLGLRNGSWGPESDERIAPTPLDATDQVYLTQFLSGTKYGFIMRNEDRDVPGELLSALRARREAFDRAGFGIERIRSRINI